MKQSYGIGNPFIKSGHEKKEVLLDDCKKCVHHKEFKGDKGKGGSVICGRTGFANLNVSVTPRPGDAKQAVYCNFYKEA